MNTGESKILSFAATMLSLGRGASEKRMSERMLTGLNGLEAAELSPGQDLDDNDQIPLTSMDQLMEEFFGVNGAFRPHYSYAQATKLPTAQRPTAPLDHSHMPMLTHDCVLHFLAPHEILALWQTSKATWESMIPKQRYFVMMRSVFGYLKISKEAAQHVDKLIIGGWYSYCPLMVSLCVHLARVYGNFETDESHRVFMAHQACFYPKSRGFWHCGSQLAEHEVRLARYTGLSGPLHDSLLATYSQTPSADD